MSEDRKDNRLSVTGYKQAIVVNELCLKPCQRESVLENCGTLASARGIKMSINSSRSSSSSCSEISIEELKARSPGNFGLDKCDCLKVYSDYLDFIECYLHTIFGLYQLLQISRRKY